MTKLRLVACVCTAIGVFAFAAGSAAADPSGGPPICNGTESPVSGTFKNLVITGNQYVPDGSTLTVTRNLTVAPGACFDAFTLGTVNVARNVSVGNGAIFALGCTFGSLGPPVQAPCFTTTTDDTVGGNITAASPMTMYLDGDTIKGNVVSTGGGPGLGLPFVNFPVKDNVIGGNLSITGWQGGWSGAIRDQVGKNLVFSGNVSALDSDSNEVVTNTVGGNLICQGNSPAVQFGDSGGLPNTVGKHKIGQCAGL